LSILGWRYKKGPVLESDFMKIEISFGIQLPELYKEIVRENNGGRPLPNRFDTENNKKRVIKAFLSIDEREGNLENVYGWIKERIPQQIIPFASDPGGNYLCFDYRSSPVDPSVVFWNHENNSIEMVSLDFTSFTKMVY